MQPLNLKGRLSLCAQYVRRGSRLADIGTDHAYLPIALCASGRTPCALACDINPLPLATAAKNIAAHGLSGRVATRLSDGLKEVRPDEADDIVIAGMGGELIAAILADCPWIRDPDKNLILQPMTRHDALIRWLYANGFGIVEQGAVLDSKKYYTVLRARYDGVQRACDAYAAHVGILTPDSEAARGFLLKTLHQLKKQVIGEPALAPAIRQIEVLLHED